MIEIANEPLGLSSCVQFNTAHSDNAVCLVADEQERVLVNLESCDGCQIHECTLTETDSLIRLVATDHDASMDVMDCDLYLCI